MVVTLVVTGIFAFPSGTSLRAAPLHLSLQLVSAPEENQRVEQRLIFGGLSAALLGPSSLSLPIPYVVETTLAELK